MDQRISLITPGATDIASLAEFHESPDWKRTPAPHGVVAFEVHGQTLGLCPIGKPAEDIGESPGTLGRGAVTLAHNLRTKDEVAVLPGRADVAGGRILKPAQDVFRGRHHGYFADPEGLIREIAYNPVSPQRADGAFRRTGYGEVD